jgi:hypothetical protein
MMAKNIKLNAFGSGTDSAASGVDICQLSASALRSEELTPRLPSAE